MINVTDIQKQAEAADARDIVVEQPAARVSSRRPQASFVGQHPVLVIAGGLAAGLVIGALIPRREKKALVRRTSALSKLIGAAAVSFGREAADRAEAAGSQVRRGSHVLADRAEDWTAVALRGASAFAQSAAENIVKLSETAAQKAESLGETAADQAGRVGHATAKRVDKAIPAVEAAASHTGKRVGKAFAEFRGRISG